jgi:RimJ/RimL family protein N-acetyltransferase
MQPAVLRAVEVPVIQTERLRLRAYRKEDFPASAQMWSDAVVTRYISGKPLTSEETWTKMLRNAGMWLVLGYGFWVLEERVTGEFVGELGFADFQRTIEPSIDGMPEVGWVLAQHAHGKGYATEATRAALDWGDQYFGATRMVCLIQPGNDASFRVADKLGFREWTRTKYKEHEVVVLTREPLAK